MKCKLCHQEGQRSSADRLMCGKCYAGLLKYKRLIVKDPSVLTPSNKDHIDQFEAMIEFNQENVGYVPRFYREPILSLSCRTCDDVYETIVETKICEACKKRENNFRSLLNRNIHSPSFKQYFMYYRNKHAQGKLVPRSYLNVKDTFFKRPSR